jgi:hypothetical protein
MTGPQQVAYLTPNSYRSADANLTFSKKAKAVCLGAYRTRFTKELAKVHGKSVARTRLKSGSSCHRRQCYPRRYRRYID